MHMVTSHTWQVLQMMTIDFRWNFNGESERMTSHEVQMKFASEQH